MLAMLACVVFWPVPAFAQEIPSDYQEVLKFLDRKAVHSLPLDVKTHRVYAPEEEEDGKPVARMVVYEAVGAR